MSKLEARRRSALTDIVASIYQAAAATQSWTSVIEQISRLVPGEPGGIIISPLIVGRDPAAVKSLWKEPDNYIATYEAYYGYQDELAQAHIENSRRDSYSFGTVGELMSRDSFEASEIYNNLLHSFDIDDTAGFAVHGTGPRMTLLGLYGEQWNERDAVANRSLFDQIRPHFDAAMHLHWRLADAEGAALAGRETLDRFRTGIIWLDQDGRILWANDSAEAMLAQKDGLAQSLGQLTTRDTLAGKKLGLALRSSISGAPSEPSVVIQRPSGKRPFSISIAPPGTDLAMVGGSRVAALLFITDLDATPDHAGRELGLVYGLSNAESRVAQGLSSGFKPEEIAAQHGSSIHTVRVQIKSIMAKMDTTRHGDIIRLAMTAAGTRRDGDGGG
jgi:DNA-binding CsgD family transcriptional regulator